MLKRLVLIIAFFTISLYAEEEQTPRKVLTKAIGMGDLDGVKDLIESSAVEIDEISEEYDFKSPLIEAAMQADIPIIKYLIEKGANIAGLSEKGYSPLEKFIEAGKRLSSEQLLDTVHFMIDHGADINGCANDGYTPLMAACEYSRSIELIQLLLDLKAFINAQTTDGKSAYICAILNSNLKAYRLLLSHGVDTNVFYEGFSPIGLLAWNGNIFMMKILLNETDADINAYNPNGLTPIMAAVIGQQSATIQFLVEKGADINAKTYNLINIRLPEEWLSLLQKHVPFPRESTALNFAITLGYVGIANLLTELGAVIYQEVEYNEVQDWPYVF